MKFLLLPVVFLCLISCYSQTEKSLINSTHLDNLYKEVVLENDTLAFIYIYAEAPSYKPVEATNEGIACIDDVARAAIFYFRYFERTSDPQYLHKAKKLVKFILKLQAENGYFYNFIKSDLSINTTRINSQAIPDWWTWRALWAISEAMILSKEIDPDYYITLLDKFNYSLNSFIHESDFSEIIANLAGDQASVLLIALTNYYNLTADSTTTIYMQQLAQNIMSKQKGAEHIFPYYAFMSWRNEWHGWGNTQAYSLLKAGRVLDDNKMIEAASNEANHFYPYLQSKNYFKRIVLITDQHDSEFEQFEQIAYAQRPMVWAALELFKISGDKKYAEQAANIAAWLTGKNITQKPVYDAKTGRCYDGINSPSKINLNSGAESTIEALLTILEIEKNPTASNYFKSISEIKD